MEQFSLSAKKQRYSPQMLFSCLYSKTRNTIIKSNEELRIYSMIKYLFAVNINKIAWKSLPQRLECFPCKRMCKYSATSKFISLQPFARSLEWRTMSVSNKFSCALNNRSLFRKSVSEREKKYHALLYFTQIRNAYCRPIFFCSVNVYWLEIQAEGFPAGKFTSGQNLIRQVHRFNFHTWNSIRRAVDLKWLKSPGKYGAENQTDAFQPSVIS